MCPGEPSSISKLSALALTGLMTASMAGDPGQPAAPTTAPRSPAGVPYVDPSVRAASKKLVDDCLASPDVPDGKSIAVDREWRSLCDPNPPAASGWDGFRKERAFYTLSRQGHRLVVSSEIVIDPQPATLSKSRKDFILSQTQACLPILQTYWDHYGITLDYKFRLKKAKEATPPPNLISVTDTPGRSHSRNYYFGGIDIPVKLPNGYTLDGGPGYTCLKRCQAIFVGGGAKNCGDICEPFREREYCQMMVHEVGHLMALPDEYADPACPAQKASQESFPYSAMGFPYAGLLDMPEVASLGGFGVDTGLVEFFPRHIRTITGPLCDPGSPEGTAQGVLTWGEGYLSSP